MILSIGNINLDYHIFVEKIPEEDEEVLSSKCILKCGGSASNFAVAIRRLGMKSRIIGCIGDDLIGKMLLEEFRKEDIDINFIRIIKGVYSGQVFILKIGNESKRMIAFRGANSYLDENIMDFKALNNILLIHASSIPSKRIEKIFEEARNRNIITSYDPGSSVIRCGEFNYNFIKKLNFLFLNRLEARLLVGCNELSKIAKLLEINKDLHIVLKCGEEGSYIINRKNILYSKAFKVKVIDVTGAGDAFNAGFLYSYLKDFGLKTSLRFGNAVAALKISRMGARELPNLNQVMKFIEIFS